MRREDGCSQRVRGRTGWDRAIECLSVVGARCLSVNSRYLAKKKKNKPVVGGEDVVRPARDSMGNPFHGGFGDIAFFAVVLARRGTYRRGGGRCHWLDRRIAEPWGRWQGWAFPCAGWAENSFSEQIEET